VPQLKKPNEMLKLASIIYIKRVKRQKIYEGKRKKTHQIAKMQKLERSRKEKQK